MNTTFQFLFRQSIHVNSDFSGYLRHISENSDYDTDKISVCVTVYACKCATAFFAETNLSCYWNITYIFLCIQSGLFFFFN